MGSDTKDKVFDWRLHVIYAACRALEFDRAARAIGAM